MVHLRGVEPRQPLVRAGRVELPFLDYQSSVFTPSSSPSPRSIRRGSNSRPPAYQTGAHNQCRGWDTTCYYILVPYKDAETQRRYQRDLLKCRRAAWLEENGPCACCGSDENLQVDHIDPRLKVSHNVWSWSEQRRARELAKCQVLCTDCHKVKTRTDKSRPIRHGTVNGYTNRRCRCVACCKANTDRKRTYRQRRRDDGLPYT